MVRFKKGDLIVPSPTQQYGWTIYKKGKCLLAEIIDVDNANETYYVKVLRHIQSEKIGHTQNLNQVSINRSFIHFGNMFEQLVNGSITQEEYEQTLRGRG